MQEFYQPDTPDTHKSDMYNTVFAGNIEDSFRLGLKFSRKQVRFYSSFYSSDIIIASPLGLKLIIAGEKSEHDFLSSIDIVMMYHAELFLMQNFDHVKLIFDHLNLLPKESHGCDFSRVKEFILDGKQKQVRQTIVFSRFNTPELNFITNNHCTNYAGYCKVAKAFDGSINQVTINVPQVHPLTRCSSESPSAMHLTLKNRDSTFSCPRSFQPCTFTRRKSHMWQSLSLDTTTLSV
jgi:U3 small nucleolar RNA-associated protein 25